MLRGDDGGIERVLSFREEKFLNTTYPLLAVLAMNDLAFFLLVLGQLVAKISREENYTNTLNQALGFEAMDKACHPSFQYFSLNPKGYLATANKFRNNAGKAYGWTTAIVQGPGQNPLLPFLNNLSEENQKLLQPVIR